MMKKNRSLPATALLISGAVLTLSIFASLTPFATAADKPEFEVTVDLASNYVWRGQVLSDGVVFQPGIGGSYAGFSLGFWGNMALGSGEDKRDLNEVDTTLAYGFDAGKVDLEFGFIHYNFPHTEVRGTTEAYASVGINDLPVTLGFAFYYDIDEADGAYVSASVGRSLYEGDKVAVEAGLSAGWATSGYNNYYFGVEESAFNDANLYVSSNYSLGKGLGLGLSAQYTWLPDSEIEAAAGEAYFDDSKFVLLLGLAYSF